MRWAFDAELRGAAAAKLCSKRCSSPLHARAQGSEAYCDDAREASPSGRARSSVSRRLTASKVWTQALRARGAEMRVRVRVSVLLAVGAAALAPQRWDAPAHKSRALQRELGACPSADAARKLLEARAADANEVNVAAVLHRAYASRAEMALSAKVAGRFRLAEPRRRRATA